MALTATYSQKFTGGNTGYTLHLDVTEDSYSIENNTSEVSWTLGITSSKPLEYGSWDFTGPQYSVTINGSEVASGTKNYDFRNYKELTVSSGTTTVEHNSDGTKTVSCSAWFGPKSGHSTPIGSATVTGDFVLTTILRDFKVYVFDGTAWQCGTPYVCNGTEWKKANIASGGVYVNNGTEWKVSSIRG